MRVTKFPLTILAAALLSGCVTRVEPAGRDSAVAHRDNTVLLVPVFVLPPDSQDGRNSPVNPPPGQSGRETQAQWLRVPASAGFDEPILFSGDQTKIHFVAIRLSSVPIETAPH